MAEATNTNEIQSSPAEKEDKLSQHPSQVEGEPIESNKRVSDTLIENTEGAESKRATTDAEKYLLTLKDRFYWSDLITADGTHICPRSCLLLYNDKLGFYISTKTIYHKIARIEKDPYATISFIPFGPTDATAIAHCTIEVSNTPEDLEAAWDDSFLQYGYKSKDDETRRVLKITVHDVVSKDKTFEGVPLDESKIVIAPRVPPALPEGPFKDEEVRTILEKVAAETPFCHLITWNGNKKEDRTVRAKYNADLGFYCASTAESNKVAQIKANPNVAIHFEHHEEHTQTVVDAFATILDDAENKKKGWYEELTKFGLSGPEDPRLVIIKLNVRSVIPKNATEPLYCEPLPFDKEAATKN